MQLQRYIVRPCSPWGTPLRSDTLAGLLLWRIAERDGSAACRDAIAAFRSGTPPFVVSSAMPAGMIFNPKLPPVRRADFRRWVEQGHFRTEKDKKTQPDIDRELFEALQKQKRFRKTPFIPVSVWAKHASNLSLRPLLQWFCTQNDEEHSSFAQKESVEPHVSINRQNSTALEGGLFFNRLRWFGEHTAFHIYARAQHPDTLLDLLHEIGNLGFGKDASTGKGRFAVERDAAFDPATLENNGSHALLCSVCASMDMSALDGWYAVAVKRGKTGPAVQSSPHKAPMLFVQEGSVLRTLPKGPWLLDGIHADPDIVQVTQPLTLPCRIAEEENHA